MTIAPGVETGSHTFRLQTVLGTTNLAVLDVGDLPEVDVDEAEASHASGQPVKLPCAITGTLQQLGEVDRFEFEGNAGQELVFRVMASPLGSALRSLLELRDSSGQVLARSDEHSRQADALLAHKLPADGKYTIAIASLEEDGGPNYFFIDCTPAPFPMWRRSFRWAFAPARRPMWRSKVST